MDINSPNFPWKEYSVTIESENAKPITISTGKLARQADGSVMVRQGDTMILATVVSNKEAKEGTDFFPLSVDYQEKFASYGRIPGGFFRRESKLSDYEVIISRLVDRTLRPTFPDFYYFDTQVILTLVSLDKEVIPDTLAGLAASAAITVSDIPFGGPISEVRVARINGKMIVNPTREQWEQADLDIIVGATTKNILMVEGEAKQCSEEDLIEAIKLGHETIKLHCQKQNELAELCGKPKREITPIAENETVKQQVNEFAKQRVYEVVKSQAGKQDRKNAFKAIKEEMLATCWTEEELASGIKPFINRYYDDLQYYTVREIILDENIRLDGRKPTEIRPIFVEPNYLPLPHGSALFCRGETQSLTTCTFGTKLDELMLDKAIGLEYQDFILHYNFPAFSTGEVKPMRGPGRREVGHGNLAMRSLKQVMPDKETCPYTVRIVSDVLESNGSSSMATVCAGSLALMDAGVQIKGAVSGIAMGLIMNEKGQYAVLSDILGDEDHLGDMDFKVTGTQNGICGVQMDIKIDGLPYEVLQKALYQARDGRLHILNIMNEAQPQPRPEPKPHAPRMERLLVPKEFIGPIIGPGGKNIQELQARTGTVVTITEIDKGGEVFISSPNKEGIQQALAHLRGVITLPEEGEIYTGKVKKIEAFGAFVEFLPGKEGLLHISEVDWKRLDSLDGILAEGDIVEVKLLEVDRRSGKFRLSRKVLLPNPNPNAPTESPRPRFDDRNRDRDRDRRDDRPRFDDRRNPRR